MTDKSTEKQREQNQAVTRYQIVVGKRPWGAPHRTMTAAELCGIRNLAPNFIDWHVIPVLAWEEVPNDHG